ncbi:hypothetical protein [Abyssogena phaseoliformis symbiont]|uniref:hypothetical protein n=1 Tax=Abyssogena phaseoliformis symbiont TaxID=596095 RepID=UPI001916B5AE|nr:hypothetical protein [Abyssogena phaseoliformis symbiont]
MKSLNNNPEKLKDYINEHQHVHLKTRNGAWTKNIVLPSGVDEGKKLTFEVKSSWGVKLNDGIQTHNLKKGDKTSWTFTQGVWTSDNVTY